MLIHLVCGTLCKLLMLNFTSVSYELEMIMIPIFAQCCEESMEQLLQCIRTGLDKPDMLEADIVQETEVRAVRAVSSQHPPSLLL